MPNQDIIISFDSILQAAINHTLILLIPILLWLFIALIVILVTRKSSTRK